MDADRFDSLTRSLTAAGSRRRALAIALGGALAALLGYQVEEIDAHDPSKKCKKKSGKQKKKCLKKAKKHNATHKNSCQDGVKNGSETDVDCGGGACSRCQGGQICNSRNDCHTALCVASTCQSCAVAADCGFESDGVTGCFCRDNAQKPGERMCTRQLCDFKGAGSTCAACAAGLQCAPAGGGIECCTPCGAA
jgi:hypothetical protein